MLLMQNYSAIPLTGMSRFWQGVAGFVSKFGGLARVVVVLGLVGVLSACSASLQQSARSDEDIIRGRAQERWNALLDLNFDEAYVYETPAFREVYSQRAYRGRFGGSVRWTDASVRSVQVGGDTAEVMVTITYVTLDPVGRPFTNERPIRELWEHSEGEWWFARR